MRTFKTFYTLALKLRLTARLMLVYKFDSVQNDDLISLTLTLDLEEERVNVFLGLLACFVMTAPSS